MATLIFCDGLIIRNGGNARARLQSLADKARTNMHLRWLSPCAGLNNEILSRVDITFAQIALFRSAQVT